jgi:hypothetical protein
MKGCAMIVLLLLAARLGEAARIFGFKPFYLNSDSQVRAAPASSYPSVEEKTTEKAVLALNERLRRRESVEKHPDSESNLKPNLSAKSKASNQRSNELLRTIIPSVKFDVVEADMEKTVAYRELLGHSAGLGHDIPPGSWH